MESEGPPEALTPLDDLVRRTSSRRTSSRRTSSRRTSSGRRDAEVSGGPGKAGAGRHLARMGSTGSPRVPPWVVAVVVVVAATIGWLGWHQLARPAPIEDRMPVAVQTDAPDGTDPDEPADPAAGAGSSGEVSGEVSVHVAGAVARPGVVELADGARVTDAVAAVGGPTADADVDRLNLAAPLVDGARIAVPRVGAEPSSEVTTSVPGPAGAGGSGTGAPGEPTVNLNTATAEELETLPGVGPATAAAILAHREDNGQFGAVEDLLEVRGIGEAKLEAVRDFVTVR